MAVDIRKVLADLVVTKPVDPNSKLKMVKIIHGLMMEKDPLSKAFTDKLTMSIENIVRELLNPQVKQDASGKPILENLSNVQQSGGMLDFIEDLL